jgi:aminoglycoside phosphotransferase (APT) family kinase protein
VTSVEGVDLVRLGEWMDDQGLGRGPVEDPERLGGGTQNVLLSFRLDGRPFVLRRPPLHKRHNSDETMRREARVLAALAHTPVPHPALVATCPDEEVIGAAFYLMEPVDGANPTVGLPPAYHSDRDWRRSLGLAVVDGAAAIGAVDHVAVGLADFGRPDGFLERQVARWRRHLDSYLALPGYPGPEIPNLEKIGVWLEENRPTTWTPGLIHGDYHLANVLAAIDHPALSAIVDWELSTIGDPLLDLGWLLATWPDPTRPAETISVVEPWDGFPTSAELVSRYADRTDRDLSAMSWYAVLACYKLGIILEGTHARALAGQADQATGDRLHTHTLALFARASRLISAS